MDAGSGKVLHTRLLFGVCFQLSSCYRKEIPAFLNVASVISELFRTASQPYPSPCNSCWQLAVLLAGGRTFAPSGDVWSVCALVSVCSVASLLEDSWTRRKFSHCCLPHFWEMGNVLPAPQFKWNGNFNKVDVLWDCNCRLSYCCLCR